MIKNIILISLTTLSLISFNLSASGNSGAGHSNGGYPNITCYVDGEYKGTMNINKCKELKSK